MAKQQVGEYWFDDQSAELACAFFSEQLAHSKGKWAGTPFRLEPWQADQVIRPLFGWKRADGTRRYRTVYLEVPRKNGKSTLAAGVALFLTFCDREPAAEVYSAATDRDQAAIVFGEASRMRERSALLRSYSHAFKRAIVVPKTHSAYKVLSADAGTKDGLNPHGVIFDELHAQKSRDLYDVLHTAMGARRQPVEFLATTAGHDRHSICWEIHDYALKVRDGIIDDPTFLPVIFAAEHDDDWQDPKVWAKANPGLGVSISMDYMREQAERARLTPAYENTFKRLHLNIWTEQATRWLPVDAWDACGDELDEESLRGRRCFGGLDLASTTDIASLALAFPDDAGDLVVVHRYWVPRETLKRREDRDRVPYPLWAKQGLLQVTEGSVVDYDVIRRDINQLAERYQIAEIAIDRWNATQLSNQLQQDGFTMVAFGQGMASMSAPTKALEALLLGRRLRHGRHPVTRWMFANMAVESDAAGNIKPAKNKATEKIDGIVAAIMAIARAQTSVPEDDLSELILERDGLL